MDPLSLHRTEHFQHNLDSISSSYAAVSSLWLQEQRDYIGPSATRRVLHLMPLGPEDSPATASQRALGSNGPMMDEWIQHDLTSRVCYVRNTIIVQGLSLNVLGIVKIQKSGTFMTFPIKVKIEIRIIRIN